ncbi:innexin inx3 [Nilaparvata lugens]|uniref:innexin inx3 n=1 Tax=Nilaparvata lugens TaxID=108931 RepID=UPI000B994083|nr:innexin inx3 [Nilaparvata lugens]
MSVFAIASSVSSFIKLRYVMDKAVIDNMVFRLHYRTTSAILFVSCVLVTANNLIGEPISCITDRSIPTYVINTYCWITHTFTLPYHINKPQGTHVAHPGVAPYVEGEDETRFHSYYQWVPFMLFFQGVLFYVPHWMWKNWEEGKMRMLTDGLRGAIVGPKETRQERQSRIVQYFIDTLHMHNVYATGYFICEALNFINVIVNMFFIDSFLGGAFLTYGIDVIKFMSQNQENRTDPMVLVFPRVTKCTFHKFGPSGSIQKHDTLCVLALNILNEKIYIFLWFWFIILAVLSGIALMYSIAVVLLPSIRETILIRRFRFGPPAGVSALIRKTQVGDFLLLHFMGQNMNMLLFGELLDEISRKLHLGNNIPTAPSTLELSPIYPSDKLRLHKETEA